jgi:hypothetical protein
MMIAGWGVGRGCIGARRLVNAERIRRANSRNRYATGLPQIDRG